MSELRVGLVGAGPWATRVHAPGIAGHPGTELVSVWARRPHAALELAGRHGASAAPSFEALLDEVDAVAFAVPPAVQAPLAIAAAKRGKHLVLDKPLAPTADEAKAVVDAAADVATIMVLILRYAPETRAWLEQARASTGWSGGAARWLSGALLDGDYSTSTWRHDGGALADVGPHVFDLLDAALGEVTEVIAAHLTEPDLWHVLLAHDSGATSAATLSMKLPLRPTITEVGVYGEAGHHVLDARATPAQDCYATLLDEFLAMVRTGSTTHPCDAARGLRVQRVVDAVVRAVTTG